VAEGINPLNEWEVNVLGRFQVIKVESVRETGPYQSCSYLPDSPNLPNQYRFDPKEIFSRNWYDPEANPSFKQICFMKYNSNG